MVHIRPRAPASHSDTTRHQKHPRAGIEWRHTDAFLDEIPAAYKAIDQVMADQEDLVQVQHTLTQILNYKGT